LLSGEGRQAEKAATFIAIGGFKSSFEHR